MLGFGLLLISAPFSPAVGQGISRSPETLTEGRRFTMLAGVGNAMGWLGAQGERYFRNGRFSAFGGLGYTWPNETCPLFASCESPTGIGDRRPPTLESLPGARPSTPCASYPARAT